jgi:hypothetical protein
MHCRTIADLEFGLTVARLELATTEIRRGEGLLGRLRGVQLKERRFQIGATLYAEPDTNPIVQVVSCELNEADHELRLAFSCDSRRSPAMQELHLHLVHDLALQSFIAGFNLLPSYAQ